MEGIINSVWGAVYWKMFHYMTITYPNNPSEKDKIFIKNYFTDYIPNLLPCPECRNNYLKHIENHKLNEDIINNKLKLIIWLIDIHNIVNKNLNKKELTLEEAIVEIFNLDVYNIEKEVEKEVEIVNYDLKKILFDLTQNENLEINLDDFFNQELLLCEDITVYSCDNINNYLNGEYSYINDYINKIKKNNMDEFTYSTNKHKKIDFNKIINLMENLISQQKSAKHKKMLITCFETICLLFI